MHQLARPGRPSLACLDGSGVPVQEFVKSFRREQVRIARFGKSKVRQEHSWLKCGARVLTLAIKLEIGEDDFVAVCGGWSMFGRGPGRGKGRFMGGGPGRHWLEDTSMLLQGIELSDEQLEKMADLRHRGFSKMGHARVDMMELRQQLLRELGKETLDKSQINALKAKIKEHKSQITDLMIDQMTEFAEILTPEQRKKIRLRKIRHFMGAGEEHEHGHWAAHEGPPPPPPQHEHRPRF